MKNRRQKNTIFLIFAALKIPKSLRNDKKFKKNTTTEIFGRKRWHVREKGGVCQTLITIEYGAYRPKGRKKLGEAIKETSRGLILKLVNM
jgi:hypothetical protein